ncbi:hypothetical protein DFH09DRAFT_1162569 [Mycena vulgaris]|nr:hypothetical protein DFH09DRAFT_1162569 [Mycena vulgaris]
MEFEHLRRNLAELQAEARSQPHDFHAQITAEIFIQCVQTSRRQISWASLSTVPLLLLQICRLWRTIALSTPSLWATLNINFGRSPAAISPDVLGKFANMWLGRAGDIPRTFGFYGSAGGDRITPLLRRHGSRLHHLSILMDEIDVSGLQEIGPLPELRTLSFACYSQSLAAFQPVRTFRDAPQLREVSLARGTIPQMLLLPWGQLTIFTGERFSIADCLRVLRDSALLKKCTFTNLEHEPQTGWGILTHSSLEDLTLSDGAGQLLHFLNLPALVAVSLDSIAFFDDPPTAFFTRSSTSLRTFTYTELHCGTDTISLEWLRIMKHLTAVKLSDTTDTFVRLFSLTLNRTVDPNFLPSLRGLEMVHNSQFIHTVDAPVTDALRSRYSASAAESSASNLESLRLVRHNIQYSLDWEEIGDIDWDALYDLRMEGMDIYVGTPDENFLW